MTEPESPAATPDSQPPLLVGIDCAVDPRKVGVVTASFADGASENGRLRLLSAECCSAGRRPETVIAETLADHSRALLAFDSPLGWPRDLGLEMGRHRAGDSIAIEPSILFRRHTDRVVKREVGQQSLDVGADRIARTAVAALQVLHRVRQSTGRAIPLAWRPGEAGEIGKTGTGAIEVYPAATLRARELANRGYKRSENRQRRIEILEQISPELDPGRHRESLLANADVLDAALCVLAARDFWADLCLQPDDPDLARKEGWIWVRRPVARGPRAARR